jgi:hypothetical protein
MARKFQSNDPFGQYRGRTMLFCRAAPENSEWIAVLFFLEPWQRKDMMKSTFQYLRFEFLSFRLTFFLVALYIFNSLPTLSFAFTVSPTEKFQKYALLIGINDYDKKKFVPLEGSRNDIFLVQKVLSERFGILEENMKILLDKRATHVAIREAFRALVEKVTSGDMVYIHYSGHGSLACDLSGDEEEPWGWDSTWVPYGSRSGVNFDNSIDCEDVKGRESSPHEDEGADSVDPAQLNDFDILDDQINRWLSSLLAKTDHVVLVSDSCHSGTVTRGKDAMATRGAPIDMRTHPLEETPVPSPPTSGIRVSACRDNEKAVEKTMADGKVHGLFTWFWCQTLQEAAPGDTWADMHRRTYARVQQRTPVQHPQIEGMSRKTVFQEQFSNRPRTATIIEVSNNGTQARIDEGKLLGVTVGSIYRKYAPDANPSPKSKLTITHSGATESDGSVQGIFQIGDQVILEKYQPNHRPFKVFLNADLENDRPLLAKLAQVVEGLTTYETTADQASSDYVLYVVRPRRKEGAFIYETPSASLPKSFLEEKPFCYILRPDETILFGNLTISLADTNYGFFRVRENLEKIARIKNLKSLTAAPGRESRVSLVVSVWEETNDLSVGDKKIEDRDWKKKDTFTATELQEYEFMVGQLLSFEILNQSKQPYFTYLVNFTESGEIIPFFPAPFRNREHGKVRPGGKREVEEVSLILEKPGIEYVRLIASSQPIDIYTLGQSDYQFENRSIKSDIPLAPLEVLLRSKTFFTRGFSQTAIAPIPISEWATVQFTLQVKD